MRFSARSVVFCSTERSRGSGCPPLEESLFRVFQVAVVQVVVAQRHGLHMPPGIVAPRGSDGKKVSCWIRGR